MDPVFHLAEINIARLKAPLDHPTIAAFTTALDPVNALADASDGFVWRLVGEAGDATDLRPFDDPDMLINMSVSESLEALVGVRLPPATAWRNHAPAERILHPPGGVPGPVVGSRGPSPDHRRGPGAIGDFCGAMDQRPTPSPSVRRSGCLGP